MTVAEFIARLQMLPQELPVYAWDDWIDFPVEYIEVAKAEKDSSSPRLDRPRRVIVHSTESPG